MTKVRGASVVASRSRRRILAGGVAFLTLVACQPQPVLRPAVVGGRPQAVQRVFLVTTRLMTDDQARRAERAPAPTLAALDVGIPPGHALGRVEFSSDAPDPERNFAVLKASTFGSERALLAAIDVAPSPEADVVVWVHGYNMTLGSAVFRHAQIAHDFDLDGPQVTFAWPSAAEPLGYLQDRDSVVVARDDLERLLVALSAGRRRVLLVGHSMGAHLVMEVLRQMAIGGQGEALGRLSGVVLLSPDLAIDVFASQIERIEPRPRPFVVALSRGDRVLGLSARLSGRQERLGSTTDVARLAALGVSVIDLTVLSGRGANDHLLAVSSPTAIALLRGLIEAEPDWGRDTPTILDVADRLLEEVVSPLELEPQG